MFIPTWLQIHVIVQGTWRTRAELVFPDFNADCDLNTGMFCFKKCCGLGLKSLNENLLFLRLFISHQLRSAALSLLQR